MSLVLLGVVVLGAGSILWYAVTLGIGPVPTSPRVRQAMVGLVPPQFEGEVHELGAGWGGLACAVARRCPKARVIAWERSPVPFLVLLISVRLRRLANVEPRWADFWSQPPSAGAGVVCYLYPHAMSRLEPQLRQCAFVVTSTFGFRGWKEAEKQVVDDLYRTPVYRYQPGDRS